MVNRNTPIAVGVAWFALSLVALADVTNKRILEESPTGENWFLKGGTFSGEHYSALTQINEKNISDLGLEWTADLPMQDGIATT
ncbi:MAG TPA: hypothetical protein DGR97_03725, partial [Gammaproteobacteria bacterium]|nr:hypothetical protein [Gammaproteobacteria bacterium]